MPNVVSSRRRLVVRGLLLLAVLTPLLSLAWANATLRYYEGPISDHFDGEQFFNPWEQADNSFIDLLRWQLSSEPAQWPDDVPVAASQPSDRVSGNELRVTFVNHATVLLQTQSLNILTDPVWSQRASPFSFVGPKRVRAPGVAFADLPPIDVVLISHNHYDHLDLPTLARLVERDQPRVIVPLGNDKIAAGIAGIEAYDWHDVVAIAPSIDVVLQPMQHWSSRWGIDRNRALWASFVITTPDGNLYFAGDSGYHQIFAQSAAQYGPFRFALIPIGTYEPRWFMRYQHMNPAEAVQAHLDLQARYSLGIHWGTFQLTDEAIDAPIEALAEVIATHRVDPEVFRALENSQSWSIPLR